MMQNHSSFPLDVIVNRGDVIRTRDLLVPNQALYQAEPRPVNALTIITLRVRIARSKYEKL